MDQLRAKGILPAVVYGPKTNNINLEMDAKDFNVVFKAAGESTLIELDLAEGKMPVLIKDIDLDPIEGTIIHVDFYAPNLKEETEVEVPLVFEGECLAIKELKGTLVKNIHELEIKCLPTDIPHEIKVDISSLNTFEDRILVKDLGISANIKVSRNPDDVVAFVQEQKDIEAELAAPIEEKVEEVEKLEKEKKEEMPEEGATAAETAKPAPAAPPAKEEKK